MATMVHSVWDSHKKPQGLVWVLCLMSVTYYIGIAKLLLLLLLLL